MPRSKQYLSPCRLSPNLVNYHHEVASIPFGEGSLESFIKGGPTDELHPLTKSSETGLGYSTNSGRQFATYVKEYQSAVRRQGESSFSSLT